MAVIVYRDMRETIPAVDREALRAAAVAGQPGRYLASFENRFGEPLVFVHDDGERDATVFLGDVDWQPCRVSDAGGQPQVADLILNDEERAFLDACWQATAWRRDALIAPVRERFDQTGQSSSAGCVGRSSCLPRRR